MTKTAIEDSDVDFPAPTVCGIVLFRSTDKALVGFPHGHAPFCPAIITRVLQNGNLNLHVFRDGMKSTHVENVPRYDPQQEKQLLTAWNWPDRTLDSDVIIDIPDGEDMASEGDTIDKSDQDIEDIEDIDHFLKKKKFDQLPDEDD